MWKKFRKFYKYNRIYCILMMISLFCFLLMATGIVVYFINQTATSKYGHRSDGLEDYKVEKIIKNIEGSLKDPKIKSKSVRDQNRIIIVHIEVDKETTIDEMKNICTETLTSISEEEKSYFDLQYIVDRDGLPSYMGSKTHTKANITFGNYNLDATTTTSASTKATTTTTTKKK